MFSISPVKKVFRYFWGFLKCQCYLLFIGMWRGQCEYREHENGRLVLRAASTGSIYNSTIQIKKVFYRA
jgi:hypothetical protein